MDRRTFIFRSATHHWRTNLAVALGAAIGTAVLTGALLVGDSMRGSLRRLTLARLGRVDHVLLAQRFFRQRLADDLAAEPEFDAALGSAAGICPTILVQGTIERLDETGNVLKRSVGVNVIGVSAAFVALFDDVDSAPPEGDEAWLNDRLADELDAGPGTRLVLQMEKPSALPRESLLGRRTETIRSLPLEITQPPLTSDLGRFGLRSNQLAPKNVFVPLARLQRALERRGQVNGLLVSGAGVEDAEQAAATNDRLAKLMHEKWQLEDLGLVVRSPEGKVAALFDRYDRNGDGQLARGERRRLPLSLQERADSNADEVLTRAEVEAYFKAHRNYLSLEGDRLLLEPAVVSAALAAAEQNGLEASPLLAYLVNDLSIGDRHVPYSIVVATNSNGAASDQIRLTKWTADRLAASPDDTLTLSYYLPEAQEGRLPTDTIDLRVKDVVAVDDAIADDGWTPDYPGITDADSIADWDPPFPGFIDLDRITEADDDYWKRYRTAPKAFIALADGRGLWSSRFGDTTSIRFALPAGIDPVVARSRLVSSLLALIVPDEVGLAFEPARADGVAASAGGTPFEGLFLGLSFFLIASAALLVGLLFRLNIEQRARQIGILLAIGHTVRWVRQSLLAEGAALVAVAGLLGVAMGVAYGGLMVHGLNVWWIGAIRTPFLTLVITPTSLVIGYVAGGAVAMGTVWWAVLALGRLTPLALLAGRVTPGVPVHGRRKGGWVAPCIAVVCMVVAGLAPAVGLATDWISETASFFVGGTAALLACLAATAVGLREDRSRSTLRSGATAIWRLAARNATRHRARSVLTASLIAAATFLVVVFAIFRFGVGEDPYARNSGTGGFRLVAESTNPLHRLPATQADRQALNIPAEADARIAQATVFGFRVRPGDEASCLNLYKPDEPRIVGAPKAFIERGGFAFKSSLAETDAERANPWHVLNKDLGEGVIPAVGDYNTVMWILHLGLGKEIELTDDHGQTVRLRISGLLSGSLLQSELVISEAAFKRHFPSRAGYSYFLIDDDPDASGDLAGTLEASLGEFGFDATDTAQRLAEYLAIENTYLDTFRTLGGLGLLLGTFGMAAVLLRNVLERRGELALMRAIGFRRRQLGLLVVAENMFLLVLGLAAGTVSALLAVAPHLVGNASGVRWASLIGTLGLVFIVGLATGIVAVVATLRAPLLGSLRSE